MAIDLNWNYSGLSSHTSAIMISQYHYSLPLYLCLLIITFIGIISLVFYIVKYFKTLKDGEGINPAPSFISLRHRGLCVLTAAVLIFLAASTWTWLISANLLSFDNCTREFLLLVKPFSLCFI